MGSTDDGIMSDGTSRASVVGRSGESGEGLWTPNTGDDGESSPMTPRLRFSAGCTTVGDTPGECVLCVAPGISGDLSTAHWCTKPPNFFATWTRMMENFDRILPSRTQRYCRFPRYST